ncbi:hypothetical protein [Croceicoccus gelatinilyticus]|nr:hypothetical protein [Croceicoccus gelatinilyticus]MBS7671061.1 hypothetical protein [Croceicoccus gelatinilyticus]
MDTGKTSILPQGNTEEGTSDIAAWLDTIAKQEGARSGGFRRTLDGLLGG